jgi:hypothetical protein
MTIDVNDLRSGERYSVLEPLPGTFGPSDMKVTNMGTSGLQILHPHPMRLGTRARVTFQHGEISVVTEARLLWSHLSQTPDPSGKLLYVSGLHIENPTPQYAAAINSLFRIGAVRQDTESMEKKRARTQEREKARRSQMSGIPSSGSN